MRRRLYAVVAVAALGLALPSSAEEPKTLDGKKTTKIEVKGNGGNQQHDLDQVVGGFGLLADSPDLFKCESETCLRLQFKYKPDNVTGDLLASIGWQNDHSDMDLYFFGPDGKEIAHCGGGTGTGEFITVPAAKLTPGSTYTLIANYYRSFDDEVTATVEFPGSKAPTYPEDLDLVYPVSCTE